jgi:hypothetical protein
MVLDASAEVVRLISSIIQWFNARYAPKPITLHAYSLGSRIPLGPIASPVLYAV